MTTYTDEPLLHVALRVAQLYTDNNTVMLTIESDEMAELLRWAANCSAERDLANELLRRVVDASGLSIEHVIADVKEFLGDDDE
jgi:hypothetical protein